MRPLEETRVLDLSHVYQGPYCTTVLSYLGADVIKVEPPGGENLRHRSGGGNPPEFQFLNPNKRDVTLNLKSDDGKEAFKDLVAESDVLVENFSVGTMENLGLGYETLREINPLLVYGHGSGFGTEGPYTQNPAMDLTIQAISGAMHTTGFPDQPPVKAGPAFADFLGGIHLAAGILGALLKREQTGSGEYVEVGMLDCIFPTLASPISAWVRDDDVPPRTGNQHAGMAIVPYNAYEVEDGYVVIICMEQGQWERLTRVMDKPELLEDDRFKTKAERAKHASAVDEIIENWLDGKTRDKTVDLLLQVDIPAAPIRTIEEVVDDPHLDERGMLQYVETREDVARGEMPLLGMPIHYRGHETPDVENAPVLGQHTEEVLRDVAGYTDGQIDDVTGPPS